MCLGTHYGCRLVRFSLAQTNRCPLFCLLVVTGCGILKRHSLHIISGGNLVIGSACVWDGVIYAAYIFSRHKSRLGRRSRYGRLYSLGSGIGCSRFWGVGGKLLYSVHIGFIANSHKQCSHSGRSSTAGRKKMPCLQLARNVAAVR